MICTTMHSNQKVLDVVAKTNLPFAPHAVVGGVNNLYVREIHWKMPTHFCCRLNLVPPLP
jgi:hypothetical protein